MRESETLPAAVSSSSLETEEANLVRSVPLLLSVGLAVAGIVSCNPFHSAPAPRNAGNQPVQAPVSDVNVTAAQVPPLPPGLPGISASWPMFGNNPWQDRYAPDQSITADSITNLHPAFVSEIPGVKGSNETYPQEVNGVLYMTTPEAHVLAVDAVNGTVLWQFTPDTHARGGAPKINRGVAVGDQNVYVLTADDQLIAISRQTGKLLFSVQVANPTQGYFETMAPILTDGKVIVGSAGGDEGIRGFVAAYDASTGKRLWQFYTVPARGEGWMPATGSHGGGAVWTTPTVDPTNHLLYFGTGNPSPDYFGQARPGPNLYTDAVVALNTDTGNLVWYRQEVTHDLWDYDVASPPVLFTIGSKRVVGEGGKDGFWYEWDAQTGEPVIQPVAFVKQQHSPPTAAGTEEWPGSDGGANYGPSAYSPATQCAYVAGINGSEVLYAKDTSHSGYSLDLGTGQNPAPASAWTGTVTSIQAATGRVMWQIATPTPPIGGVTVSAGGIVFFGLADGTLEGVEADTGRLLWKVETGESIGSAPILYEIAGHTYVVVVTGGAKSFSNLFPWAGPDHILGYRL